jgi:hypothetical protein
MTRNPVQTTPGTGGDDTNPSQPVPGDDHNTPGDDGTEPGDVVSPDDSTPGEEGNDTTEPGVKDEDTNKGELPRTGDDSYIDTYLNIGISVLAALLFVLLVVKKKRKVQEK